MNQQLPTIDSSSDDRLWALLTYIFTPLIPIVIMLMPDKKDRPFLKAHNGQALVLGIAEWLINILLTPVAFVGCFTAIITIIANIYLGLKANKGEVFELPIIGPFVKSQGW